MTGITKRCGEKACAQLSAKRYQLPVRRGLGEVGSVFPSRLSTPVWERALGVGSVRGMGVGFGVEVGVAVGLAVAVGVGVAVGDGDAVGVGVGVGPPLGDTRTK